MGRLCLLLNKSDQEVWLSLEFTSGKGCVANLLPAQKRTFCAPPEEDVAAIVVHPTQEAAQAEMPDAFVVVSRRS
jgi:hypothetical protein